MRKTFSKDSERDPARILKLKEITDFLLAGGYFRVRIPSLSPFDKVVGGLCWSITASGVGVDVDILFQEQLQIKQRISLSEKLVEALVKIKSPPIQPHQISELDYDALLPVIQFMVKKVLETRRLTGDLVRALAVSQFSKNFTLTDSESQLRSREALTTAKEHYEQPQRQFKKADSSNFESLASKTEATLLEYGDTSFQSVHVDQEAQDRRDAKKAARGKGKLLAHASSAADEKAKEEKEAEEKKAAAEEKKIAQLKEKLASVDQADKLSGVNVLNVMRQGASMIQAAEQKYEEASKLAETTNDLVESGKMGAQRMHTRQVDNLKNKQVNIEKIIEEKKDRYIQSKSKVKTLKAELMEKEQKQQMIIDATKELEAKEANATDEQKQILIKLKELVFLNESLKNQEKQFKLSCKDERDRLIKSIEDLKTGNAEDVETKRLREVDRIYNAYLAKLNQIRAILAEKNQAIAKVNREIDEIPTRAELLQFERRFAELNDLDSAKLLESRKYYAMHNTLDESYTFMQSELDVLNSIIEGFPNAQKSKAGIQSYMQQVSDILAGIREQQEQVDQEHSQEVAIRDELLAKYNSLLEGQRKYFKCVKEFQEECFKNEKYINALEEIKRRAAAQQQSETTQ